MAQVIYDLVSTSDVAIAHEIEVASFPPDEAATLDKFLYRQTNAPDLFLGAYLPNGSSQELVGYVCSTLSPSATLTHESMSVHVPHASSVCIHAVCTSPSQRRNGIALGLLKEYLKRLEESKKYERVLLITHEDMRGLYEKAGFEWVGKSAVVHGSEPWFEMRKIFGPSNVLSTSASSPEAPAVESQQLPSGLWEALLASSSSARKRPAARLLSSLPNGLKDVSQGVGENVTNSVDLLCPRQGCGSIILKDGVATLQERPSVRFEPEGVQITNGLLEPLPQPGIPTHWWKITPNAMAFENIGFSKAVIGQDGELTGKKLKLLSCADCDLGPLGWSEEGGSEFWLPVGRMGYRE